MIPSFKIFLSARERTRVFYLYVTRKQSVKFVVIRELSCFAWLNFRFFQSSSKGGSSLLAGFLVALWTDKPFVTYFVASMILTDMICNAEIKFLQLYVFPTPYSMAQSFLREREKVLVITRHAWKGQIFYVIQFFNWVIGDPEWSHGVLLTANRWTVVNGPTCNCNYEI